jgi:hypothetical protein
MTIGPRAKPALDRLIGAPLNLVRRKRIAAVPKKRHDGAARQHGIESPQAPPSGIGFEQRLGL